MSGDDGWIDLGHGVSVRPYTQGGIDGHAGLLERHPCTTSKDHIGMLPFNRGQRHDAWTVLSSDPWTLDGSVQCHTCGLHGWIRDGKWVPA